MVGAAQIDCAEIDDISLVASRYARIVEDPVATIAG